MLHNGSAHDGGGQQGQMQRPALVTSATVSGKWSGSGSGGSGIAGRSEKQWKRSLSMSSLAAPFVGSSHPSSATTARKKSLFTSASLSAAKGGQEEGTEANGSKRARGHGYSNVPGMPLTPPAVAEDPDRELGTEFSGSAGYRQTPLHRSPPESIYISFPAIADDDDSTSASTTKAARQPPIVKA